MKPTDFSTHLTQFLTHYLAAQRNLQAAGQRGIIFHQQYFQRQ